MKNSDTTLGLYQSLLSGLIRPSPPSPTQQAFLELKKNLELNPTFDEVIQQKHNAVRSVLENKGVKDTKLIGSLQRKTRIQPNTNGVFDIDILVMLGEFYGWVPANQGVSPYAAMETLHTKVAESKRYCAMKPEKDQPTITIEHENGVKVELVPAYLDMIGHSRDKIPHSPRGRAYWVPKNGKWELADYDHEADCLSKTNDYCSGLLVPTIKMLKAIKRIYFSTMSSIHLETLALHIIPSCIDARKQSKSSISYSDLITDFFRYSMSLLSYPVKIPNSLSPSFQLDAFSLTYVPNSFNTISNFCNNINLIRSDTEKLKQWKTLFKDAFPAI